MKLFELFEGDVIKGPWSTPKQAAIKKYQSIRSAFGGPEYNVIRDAGYKFTEKPDYFSDINAVIPKAEIGRLQNAIGRKLKVYDKLDVLYLRSNRDEENPLLDYDDEPEEETFILKSGGDYYLCNKTGASKYIRMWARIK